MSQKVLIVDDEKDFLDIIAERILARGMDVSTATSAEEALKMVETSIPRASIRSAMISKKSFSSSTINTFCGMRYTS